MRNLLAFLALASIGTLAVACSQPTLEETVQQFLDNNGMDNLQDCGQADLDLTCSSTPPKEVQCFLDAFAACKPAQLITKQSSIEGDPIFTEYVVRPQGTGCGLELFVDTTQDQFGEKKITQQSCDKPSGNATCESTLSADGCDGTCGSGADCG